MTLVATWPSTISELLGQFDRSGSSMKTSQVFCHQTKEMISAIFLGEVAKLGYGFAYRVLDAQHFGVPQRRRRVFVVGCADGDWRSAAAVLFDAKSLQGDLASSRQEGEEDSTLASFGLTNESRSVGRGIDDFKPAGSLTAGMYHHGSINNQCLGTNAHLIMEKKGIVHANKVAPTMTSSGPPYSRTGQEAVEAEALVVQQEVDLFNQELTGDLHCPLRTAGGHGAPAMMEGTIVRRLTPA